MVIFLARVLSIPKNIDNITKNKWLKFQRPVSNTLDFIQIYVVINTENHNLRKMEFKVKSCSEASILNYIYIHKGNIPVIYYFPYNSEILVNK